MSDITVRATDLARSYGSRSAVSGVSFELRQGEVLGLLGPNGAGKTTTLQMLAGCLAPSTGAIEICGIDLLEQPRQAKALLGYLPETPPLYRELTVDEFLRLAARLRRIAKPAIAAAVERAKQRCGLSGTGQRLIGSLSKGYQQRVGIAQAIVHNPRVVILDEPTVGLDPIQIREIRSLIRELGGEHSVILSTHILPEVESVCDRIQIMARGQLVFNGSVDELKNAHPEQSSLEEVFIQLTNGQGENRHVRSLSPTSPPAPVKGVPAGFPPLRGDHGEKGESDDVSLRDNHVKQEESA